jgi:hypothetical protein
MELLGVIIRLVSKLPGLFERLPGGWFRKTKKKVND